MKKEFYQQQQQIATATKKMQLSKSHKFTTIRTALFIGLVFAFATGYDGHVAGTISGLMLLIAFIYAIRQHNHLKYQLELTISRLAVINSYLARFTNDWHNLKAAGSEFRHAKRPQEIDLHILGKASLYQYLCLAQTKLGRQKLAASLAVFPAKKQTIRNRQEAVAELINQPSLCLDFLALNNMLPENHDTKPLIATITNMQQYSPGSWENRARFFLPLLTLLSLLLWLADLTSISVPAFLFSLQLLLAVIFFNRHQQLLAPLKDFNRELNLYAALFAKFTDTDFKSARLRAMQQKLLSSPNANVSLTKLNQLADKVRMRNNIFFFVLANTLLLWDFHCTINFLRWCQPASKSVAKWLDLWAEFEVILSLAIVGQTRNTWTMPKILNGTPAVKANALSSLLINEKLSVANDSALTAETRIITGSNMSGKTTYMRTIASSAVLAYAGAPVCAKAFALTPLFIFTSIQVNDDLAHGISTFYAELLRLKQIVKFSHRRLPMLICIDEIFKGTNSADRIVGAKEAIKHLTQPWCITIVTTHDFELCDLKAAGNVPITNFHFEEYYQADKIHFDFKLKPGRCHTTNAKYLLHMAGILD